MTSQQANENEFPNSYYVVPLKANPSDKNPYLRCGYFTADWVGVAGSSLFYYENGWNSPFVCIVQPIEADVRKHLKCCSEVDFTATLYAAVAQTRNGDKSMPTLFAAEGRRVIIPVLCDHSRAVVLVFTKQIAGGATLIATADPEIKPGPDDMRG